MGRKISLPMLTCMPVGRSVFDRTFVDTFFVVALTNQHDTYHSQASRLADEYEGRPLLTTDAVLLEIGNALARRFKSEAIEIIDSFFSSPEVEIVRLSPELFEQAYELYQAYRDKEWGLVDCISFVVMRQMNIHQALTFDQHYIQAGFKALMRL